MEIKEVEKMLSVSRSNIRFYEKEGLLSPERKENNYRDYSEKDIAVLKKILVLRKLGFTVEEISSMQKGELSLADAANDNISRLEEEIKTLKGALEMTKTISAEKIAFETMDQEQLWNDIVQSEHNGQGFVDICKDYLMFELSSFDAMWKFVFFHDFKKSRKRYGVPIACGILLLICIIRGISKVVIWQESFWEGFLYPIILFACGSIILLPIYILSKKVPKIASIIGTVFMVAGSAFLVLCVLVILVGLIIGIINSI